VILIITNKQFSRALLAGDKSLQAIRNRDVGVWRLMALLVGVCRHDSYIGGLWLSWLPHRVGARSRHRIDIALVSLWCRRARGSRPFIEAQGHPRPKTLLARIDLAQAIPPPTQPIVEGSSGDVLAAPDCLEALRNGSNLR
jgi:hypothetical protein